MTLYELLAERFFIKYLKVLGVVEMCEDSEKL